MLGWALAPLLFLHPSCSTLAFMTTVLPNPRPGCYARNFPPVPAGGGSAYVPAYPPFLPARCLPASAPANGCRRKGAAAFSCPARLAPHHPRPLLRRESSADWREFVAVGFSAKRGSGCNDLVVSGHGVVYAAVPLALSTFYPLPAWRSGAAAVAWLAVLKLCLQVGHCCVLPCRAAVPRRA